MRRGWLGERGGSKVRWDDEENADTFHDGGERRGVLEARGNNRPPSDLQSGSHFYFQIKLFSPFRVRLMLFKLQALLIGGLFHRH